MLLPTNKQIYWEIFTFQNGQPHWKDLLDTNLSFNLLYSLQIVESFIMQPDGHTVCTNSLIYTKYL
jgi:uncharacterized protein YbcV (DUF1398 family)